MLDLNKIGKFIVELRKQGNLTQLELGKKLNVSDKSVSKWERGINAPDISVLNELSKILGVTTTELLNGERNNREISIDSIKFYNSKSKVKYFRYFMTIIMILIILFSLLFVINNYNRFQVYSVSSKSEDFIISGYIIFNKERNIGFINKIEYISEQTGTGDEILVQRLSISLKNDQEILYSITYEYETIQLLSKGLEDITLYLDEYIDNHEDILIHSLNTLVIEISYIDATAQRKKMIVPISLFKIDSGITFNY